MPPQKQPTREEFIQSLFLLAPTDNITSEKEAQKKLISGVRKGFDAIKVSYGSAGSNAIIEEHLYPFYRATNDGKTILDAIKLADSVEMIGFNGMKEVADKSDKESGDGRKTAALLYSAILFEGEKVKEHPMEVKRSIEECLPILLKSIDDQTKQITPDEVGAIATIASENKELGQMFQEIYQKIGKDGIVELDNSGLSESFYEIMPEGVRFKGAGFTWPYMANEDKGRKAVYTFPKILITKQKITDMQDIGFITKKLVDLGQDKLVIVCDDIDPKVSAAIAYRHVGQDPQTGKPVTPFETLVIKVPTLWKDWIFEDFAKVTGATIVNPHEGVSMRTFKMEYLGTADKIITSKDETVVIGIQDISEHVSKLKELGTDDSKIRIARLQTKTAILKLGANSETELGYLRAKALDARNASFLALNGGVVVGGGVSLSNALRELPDTIGGNILKEALEYPMKQIVENAGGTYGKNVGRKTAEWGFNATTGSYMNLAKEGIFDPAIVVKNSLTNALSVAATRLTARLVITKPKP